jgi:hypothetical protein
LDEILPQTRLIEKPNKVVAPASHLLSAPGHQGQAIFGVVNAGRVS